MKPKIAKYDVLLNYIGTFVSMFSNFLILPFMLLYMRSDTMGLWYVYLSLGGIVTLFDFGFNPTIARNIAYCWSGARQIQKQGISNCVNEEVDYRLFASIWKTCRWIYFLIASLAFALLIVFGSLYINNIAREIISLRLYLSWMLYCVGIFLNLYYGYYATMLRGVAAISYLNIAIIVSRVFQLLMSAIMLYLGFDILAVAIGYFMYGILYRIMAKQFLLNYQGIGERVKCYFHEILTTEIISTFKIMWYNAWRDGIVSVSTYICNQALTLILSFYFSLEETGGYSLIVQIVTALVTVAATLYTAYQPNLQAFSLRGEKDKLKKIMSMVMVVYWGIVLGGMGVLVLAGKSVLGIFKPELNISTFMICLVGIYQILLKRQAVFASYISNMNQVIYMKAFILSGSLSIGVAWFVAANICQNIYVLIGIQVISQAVYNNWHWSSYVKKSLDIKSIEMLSIGIKELGKSIGIKK